jgi:hypothetical protein
MNFVTARLREEMEMLQRLWIALSEEVKLKKKKREKEKKVCGQVVTEIIVCCQDVTVFRIPQRAKAARQPKS